MASPKNKEPQEGAEKEKENGWEDYPQGPVPPHRWDDERRPAGCRDVREVHQAALEAARPQDQAWGRGVPWRRRDLPVRRWGPADQQGALRCSGRLAPEDGCGPPLACHRGHRYPHRGWGQERPGDVRHRLAIGNTALAVRGCGEWLGTLPIHHIYIWPWQGVYIMKYTFTTENGTEKTINIPDEVFVQGRKEGLSNRETIERYLSDEGYIVDPTVVELTAKAKANGAGVRAKGTTRKKPTRKPDDVKRMLVQTLFECIDELGMTKNVEVTNIERMIAFSIGDDNFELTLSKKRKPKA